jgi:hypothetical protein
VSQLTRPRIAGITPREPIGAVLRIGRKNPDRGQPEMNDQFFIVEPHQSPLMVQRGGKSVDVGQRRPHPDFAFYNSLPADKRRTFYGMLVHATEAEAGDWRYNAMELPGTMPKKDGGVAWPKVPGFKGAACSSEDGRTASRLYGIGEKGELDYREIPCPNKACEFQQRFSSLPKGVKNPPCGSYGRLYFMPRWKAADYEMEEVPRFQRPPMKWITGSVGSVANLIGFFDSLAAFVDQGLRRQPGEIGYYGVPFVLRLGMSTNPKEKTRFPVVRVTPDGEFADFFMGREQQLRMAGAGELKLIATAATDPDEIEVLPEDIIDVSVPTAQMRIGE